MSSIQSLDFVDLHPVTRHMLPNQLLQWTSPLVTPFAGAKAAPSGQATERGRYAC
jgi:hypothetical protein